MSNIYKIHCLILAFLSCAVAAETDTTECKKQFEKLLQTSVDCTVKVRPDSLKDIVAITNGLVQDAACHIPLQFEKSAVYGRWIKQNSVQLPKLQVNCQLTGATKESLPVTTFIQPRCFRNKQRGWDCTINMSDTSGLGVMATLLENQINNNQRLKYDMEKFLMSL